jgi:hypothetical protein
MVGLPLTRNVLNMTVMATYMPFVGRGWQVASGYLRRLTGGDAHPADTMHSQS